MSKNNKDKKVKLPIVPDNNYMNVNKLEETENRLYEEKQHIEMLKNENYKLSSELKQKEVTFVKLFPLTFR